MRRALAELAACTALAVGAEDAPRWYAQFDNDAGFETDRWYSSGMRLARVQRDDDHAIELGLLQEVYTPEAKFFEPGRVERRPAARLLLYGARHDYAPSRFQTLELAAGVRGPGAMGERTTELAHRVVSARYVNWDREGGNRLDLQLSAVRTHSLGALRLHYGAVAGTQLAFAHGGIEWRIGEGYVGMDTPVLRFAATPPLTAGRMGQSGWGAFVGASTRAVMRNALLDEGYDALEPAPRRKKLVARVAAGVSSAFGWGAVVFAMSQDSREYASQRTPHRFASITVHVPF